MKVEEYDSDDDDFKESSAVKREIKCSVFDEGPGQYSGTSSLLNPISVMHPFMPVWTN